MPTIWRILGLIACLASISSLPALAADGHSLSGKLQISESGRDATRREARTAIVYFVPDQQEAVQPLAEEVEMTMVRKDFQPRVLAVPKGTTVRFPNQDTILHNVFSVSGDNRFDLGLYRRGEGKTAQMVHPGVVRVFCNVHHSMVGYVVVVDSEFYTYPEIDGSFSFDGLPAGSGTLHIWQERAGASSIPIVLPTPHSVDVEIQVSRPRIPPHRNKYGKPYPRTRRGRAY